MTTRPVRLLLVRHGQSEWNEVGRWQGHADPPLTPLGRAQARHAARRLGPVDGVASSDLRRAAVTADVIAEHLDLGPPTRHRALRERDAGPWQGRTHDEIEQGWPGYLASGRRPDGFEQDGPLLARVVPALLALGSSAPAGSVLLVVTHGGVLRALDRSHGCDGERFANLGGRWWEVGGRTLTPGEREVLVDPDEVTRPEET